jgi:alkyl hydroperoxide reductase subunit AhpC
MRSITLALALALPTLALAEGVNVGDKAPDFTLTDLDGKTVKLSDLKGKRVVLEWFNPGCPYVVHAHDEGGLKTTATDRSGDVVWLAINSGAPGKQGHGPQTNREAAAKWSMTHPILLDESGAVGKSYAAKTTPHMYIIDEKGKLAYQGALDNAPRGATPETGYQPYLTDGIDALKAGEAPRPPQTKPWGCSVKYGS